MQDQHTGYIHSIETFGAVDGPGIRFVVFMQGCAMRCQYCHNPDTWTRTGGTPMKASRLIERALRCQSYWGKEGGITVSGGEALLQIDFVIELFEQAKAHGIHTCLDTAGQPFEMNEEYLKTFDRLLQVTDLILLDLKHIDEAAHKKLTGRGNQNILQLFHYLNQKRKPVWVRHVLVPTVTDDVRSLRRMKAFLRQFDNIERVDILPYHDMAVYKWENLGLAYPLLDIRPPSDKQVKELTRFFNPPKPDTLAQSIA